MFILDEEVYTCPVICKMEKMLAGAQRRARSKDRDFNLDLNHIVELYVEICPVLGIELLWDNKGITRAGSPSLDRINNRNGYVKGNVQIISHRANSLKKDYLLIEWRKMEKYMSNCNGKPIEIVDDYFKECEDLSDTLNRDIRAALRRKKSPIDISHDLGISVVPVIKVIRELNRKQ